MPERIDQISQDLQAHAKTLSVFTEEFGKVHQRLSTLEDWRHQQNIIDARENERDISLYRRLDEIEDSIKSSREESKTGIESIRTESKTGIESIRGFGWKLFWLVAGTCVSLFVAFVFNGGLMK